MRLVFVGTGAIGLPTLQALARSSHEIVGVVSQPDKPVGRHQRVEPTPIKHGATGVGLAVFQPAKIKEAAAVERIRQWAPDVIVVMAYGQILPRDVLQAPRIACLNLHASLLPRWRGAAPIQAAIAAGDRETGITVMHVDEGLDTGDMVLKEVIPISDADTGGSLHDRLAQIAPAALLRALELLEKGTAPRIPQNASEATYAPKLSRESGRIDWMEPAEVIARKIRAFNPWPGSFARIKFGEEIRQVKVFGAAATDGASSPGEILSADDKLIVGTGDRALLLTDVQLENRKRMSAAEFIRGNRWINSAARFQLAD